MTPDPSTPPPKPPLRRRYPATFWGVVGLLVAMAIALPLVWPMLRSTDESPSDVAVRIEGVGRAALRRDAQQNYVYDVQTPDGRTTTMSPRDFAGYAFAQNHQRGTLYRVLNITGMWGVAWVALGLGGQVLFTGRMVVQWLVSESRRRSVVPVSFWWMSLAGATMLLAYFAWRRDIVGILGQSTGWFIYARNLWLIRVNRPEPAR